MRTRLAILALTGMIALAACGRGEATSPSLAGNDGESIDLVPDFAVSNAAEVDGAGIGASMLPASLRLTAEQKAQIEALHEAFRAAHKTDIDALKAIEAAARAARHEGRPRSEVRAILATALPILARLHAAFGELQDDIWEIYTPEQRAWIEAHHPRLCGPNGPPQLTDDQIAAIRALRDAFETANHSDLELIRQTFHDARAAHQAGATREEIDAIFARASAALDRLRAAEIKLKADIEALLTPEQRTSFCLVRPHGGHGHG
jgi:Spy/CpxP family protein refolding chaperone